MNAGGTMELASRICCSLRSVGTVGPSVVAWASSNRDRDRNNPVNISLQARYLLKGCCAYNESVSCVSANSGGLCCCQGAAIIKPDCMSPWDPSHGDSPTGLLVHARGVEFPPLCPSENAF